MNLLLRKILLLLFCFPFAFYTNGQVNVSQEISPAQINKDQYATFKIIVENGNDIRQVLPPSLKNFIVVSGPNQESGMTSINGHVKQYSALTFVLKPRQAGKLIIESSTVNIAGKAYKTNSSVLMVKNATTPGGGSASSMPVNPFANFDPFADSKPSNDYNDYILHKGENVADKVNKSMQMRLETDKTTCFVGEPIVASYKLYTRLKSESKLTENPSFNGFSVIDLTRPDISGYTTQKLNGREYNVYTIRKAQLYPLQSGNIELESAELENNIQFIKDEYVNNRNNDLSRLFDDLGDAAVPREGMINQTVNLKSIPVMIIVKPLPEVNKPASFAGAVGSFSIESQIQKPSFPSNEAGKLIVKISGNGNMQLLTAPVLDWPAGIDPFDPKVSEDLDKMSVPVSGTKTFEYSFSVNAEGNYILPAIKFSYFDPKLAEYKTITTKDISFTVTKATGPVAPVPVVTNNKETVSGINKIFNNRWWIIEFIAAVMMIGLIIWLRKNKKEPAKQTAEVVIKNEEEIKLNSIVEASVINQQNPLEKTEECLYMDNCTDFYSLLNTELKNYLSHKLLVDASEINTKNIAVAMDKKNISNDTALQLQQLLQEIEWQLYTPFERNEKMNTLYQGAHDIIQQINAHEIKHL